ncbi:hypothetical protein EON65_02190 [archaeon]|nr:MAG: hypothetical protein EON65_02190 [archaeon]
MFLNFICIVQLLVSRFTPYDVDRLPNNVSELKANPPTAWTSETEQIVLRSLSFSEFEMMSHPLLILTVVATSDVDPVAAMLELASVHHTPACFTNGQYEPLVQRGYVLLDDVGERTKDPFAVLRTLHARFPPSNTKLISINTLPATSPHLQQPDMWSKFATPRYFPQHCPVLEEGVVPRDSRTGKPVLGCRLSGDDFMRLREFCVWLFNEQIVPAIEKRLTVLNKLVKDARGGMKNVISRFWRKPRDESDSPKGGVKYRHDKIETQTLMLADTSFMVRDYETASSMYKLARDDYKSDKSILHLSYTLLMIAICQLITEPQKYREIQGYLETLSQCLLPNLELVHSNAILSVLCAEVYVASSYGRAPLESARVLLLAAQNLSKYPVLTGLLVERASLFLLQGFQIRRYISHCILAGSKLQKCGAMPAQHAMTCFATAMMLIEKGHWGDMKTKLTKALAQDLKTGSVLARQRALMLLLKVLASLVNDSRDVTSQNGVMDAISVLNEVRTDGGWGNIRINEGWSYCPTREYLLGPLPIGSLEDGTDSNAISKIEVCGLSIPQIDMGSIEILEPINGFDEEMLHTISPDLLRERDMMKELLAAERLVISKQLTEVEKERLLAREWAQITRKYRCSVAKAKDDFVTQKRSVPLGEKVWCKVQMTNKLPIDLTLSNLCLGIDRGDCFAIKQVQSRLNADQTVEVLLQAEPKVAGSFKLTNMQWSLSEALTIKQSLYCQGPLLQKTLKQRANRERGEDLRLQFDVVPASPLLRMSMDGLSSDGLQGQVIKSKLRILNEGAAVAQSIYIKCSHPCFLFYYAEDDSANTQAGGKKPIDFVGYSTTVVELSGITIVPGKELVLDVWLRMSNAGAQYLSLLASYNSPEDISRHSFISVQMQGLPCTKLSVQLLPKLTSSVRYTLITELTNLFKQQRVHDAELPRASSLLDSMERPNMLERHAEVDEQCMRIVGMRVLGAATLTNNKQTQLSADNLCLTSPGERLAECYSLNFFTPLQKKEGLNTWLMPLHEADLDEFSRIAGPGVGLLDICSRFQSLWYCVSAFSELVVEAKMAIELEEVEADVMGPRSIQDVRKERQQKEDESNAHSNNSNASEVRRYLFDLQAISDCEVARNSLSVSAFWVCRWNKKLRWGFHHMPRVGYASALSHANEHTSLSEHSSLLANKVATLSPSPSTSVAKVVARALTLAASMHSTGNPLAALQFALSHTTQIELLEGQVMTLPVHLTIRSFVDEDVVLQVRVRPLPDISKSNKPNDQSIVRVAMPGVVYKNQVAFCDLPLQGHGEVSLKFDVAVTSKGVHNLSR